MVNDIKQLIAEELLSQSFEITAEYLKILEPLYENGFPKVIEIDIDKVNGTAKAYVAIKDEPFYLLFTFDIENDIVLINIDTAPFISISYTPVSEELELDNLLDLTTVTPAKTIKKGEKWGRGFDYTYNGLEFICNDVPGSFQDKLRIFLDLLETDSHGIKLLSEKTMCKHIFVTIISHIGTGNFTGLWLDNTLLKRLSELNLELTFDIYTNGKKLYNNM